MTTGRWQLDRQVVVEKDECSGSTGLARRAGLSLEFPTPRVQTDWWRGTSGVSWQGAHYPNMADKLIWTSKKSTTWSCRRVCTRDYRRVWGLFSEGVGYVTCSQDTHIGSSNFDRMQLLSQIWLLEVWRESVTWKERKGPRDRRTTDSCGRLMSESPPRLFSGLLPNLDWNVFHHKVSLTKQSRRHTQRTLSEFWSIYSRCSSDKSSQ